MVVLWWSIGIWLLICVTHWLSDSDVFGKVFISQLKHGPRPFLGQAIFLALAGLLSYMAVRMFRGQRRLAGKFYVVATVLVLGLLLTPASSVKHILMYIVLIPLVATGYYIFLLRNDYYREFFAYLALLLLLLGVGQMAGYAVMQKLLVLYLLLVVNLHAYEARLREDAVEPVFMSREQRLKRIAIIGRAEDGDAGSASRTTDSNRDRPA